jgi:hypothetical protein
LRATEKPWCGIERVKEIPSKPRASLKLQAIVNRQRRWWVSFSVWGRLLTVANLRADCQSAQTARVSNPRAG